MSPSPAARPALGAVRRSFAPWSDPAAEPLIRFEGVTKRFGAMTAVNALSLDIYERELFCLLGPSGCGKSTLLRLLAGFEQPDEGRVLLGGGDLTGVPPHRRPVNMMFQSYALFPHLTVAQNIAYGPRRAGAPARVIAERVAEMVRLVQLEGLEHRRPDQLSGGQRQRVALARALARAPKVLLLDEPLGALDKRLREDTQFELMDLQVRLGTTFVVVTHDQEEAMTLASRIAVMDRGQVVQVGPPAEIYEQPRTRFVAGFVGDVNLFEGRVVGRDEAGLWRLESADAPGGFLVEAGGDLTPGQAAAVAVRPEKLRLDRGAGPEEGPNRLVGAVWDMGYLGDWTTYRVRLPSGTVVRASQANAARRAEAPIGWEEPVTAWFAPDAAVLLVE